MNPDRRHILHVTPLAAVGGCETNCLRVIRAREGDAHTVLVLGERGPLSEAFEGAGAAVEHLGTWGSGRARFPKPDGVISWSTSRLPVLFGALGAWGVPWVVYLGNPVAPGIVGSIRRRAWEMTPPPSFPVTLAACSEHTAKSHRKEPYFRRFRTEVIYNSVDPEFDLSRRHRDLSPGSAPRIGMVARLDRIKDHSTLIRAVAELSRERSDVVVEFAGDGPLRGALEAEARGLGIASRVRFLGFQRVAPLLAGWDLYVHSTTDSEGMGTAVAEAMMAGLPCAVTDIPVMREVCGPDGAVYSKARDPGSLARILLELMGDAPRRAALGHSAQLRARAMFGLDSTASGYSRLLFQDALVPQQ
jgi:glycosyltransferase involved in cell wall biosynthesis